MDLPEVKIDLDDCRAGLKQEADQPDGAILDVDCSSAGILCGRTCQWLPRRKLQVPISPRARYPLPGSLELQVSLDSGIWILEFYSVGSITRPRTLRICV